MYRILAVEDDQDAISVLQLILGKNGFIYDIAEDGEEALELAISYPYDVILLDIMLPKLDGYKVLEKIRKRKIKTPVIITSALDTEKNILDGLKGLADDYITKPFNPDELIARIFTQIRRLLNSADNVVNLDSDIKFDVQQMMFFYKNNYIKITNTEMRLLYYLLRNRSRAVPKEEIMNYLYFEASIPQISVLDSTLSNIRKKWSMFPVKHNFIETVHDKGLKFQL